jgi:hypothetical protein
MRMYDDFEIRDDDFEMEALACVGDVLNGEKGTPFDINDKHHKDVIKDAIVFAYECLDGGVMERVTETLQEEGLAWNEDCSQFVFKTSMALKEE